MAESELGVASLRIVVDTSAALSALAQFRTRFANEIDDLGSINFRGVERGAAEAGQRAGRAIRDGITNATANLRFDNIREALDFSDALNGTLRDLRQYREALVALREVTPATAAGFAQLNDVIEAAGQAIRNYSAGTDQLQDSARRINLRELTAQLREQRQEATANARVDREWAEAIGTIESAQRSAARATREATRAARQQLRAYLDLARTGVGTAAGAAGAVGRGVAGAARTGVKLGKAAYGIGAELGIFEDPKPGKVTAAIQTVIDRLKFLGEQATTTRGFLLRTFEAGGVAAVAQYRDQLKTVLDLITGTTGAANAATGAVGALREAFNNNWLLGNGNTLIGKALNAIAPATDAISATTGALDSLTRTGANAFLDALSGVNQFSDAIVNLDPKIQALAIGLGGLSVAFREKPIVEGLSRVTEYLEGLRTQALQVRGDLQSILSKELQNSGLSPAEREQKARNAEYLRQRRQAIIQAREIQQRLLNAPLALPNTELLQQRLESSGSPKPQQLRPGLNATNEQAVEALRRQVIEAQNLAKAEGQVQAAQTSLNAALEAGLNVLRTTVDVINEQVQGYRFQKEELADILALEERRRAAESQRTREARSRLTQESATRDAVKQAREDRIQQKRSEDFERRLARIQERNRARADRRKRLGEAGSNALIGGAFPLLFGQGLGASIGGGAGGLIGGFAGGQLGFGLSLLGTAVGAQFDAALAKLKTIGDALNKPVESFQALKEAALLSSRAVEKNIQNLIDNGKTAEAALQIQIDLVKRFGSTKEVSNLAAAQDELNRTYSELGVTTAKLVAGPMAALLGVLNRALGGKPTGPGANRLVSSNDFQGVVKDVRSQFGSRAANQLVGRQLAIQAQEQAKVPFISRLLTPRLFNNDLGIASERANKIALDEARQRGIITDRQRKTQQEINALEARAAALSKERAAASQLDYKITQATAQGYKLQLFYLQQQKIIRDRDLAVKDNPSKAASIREQARKDLFANQEERRAYLRQQVERLKPAPVKEINNIRATIDAAQKDRQAAFTNYSNLLNDPKASRPEQIAAGKELVAAAIAFKTAMVDGARQIADVVTGAANRLTQARLELSGIQADPNAGLNSFLGPGDRQARLNKATANLGPDLERSISIANRMLKNDGVSLDKSLIAGLRAIIGDAKGVSGTGATPTQIYGSINGMPLTSAPFGKIVGPYATQEGYQQVDAFIKAVLGENTARQNVVTAQYDIAAINTELTGVNSKLLKQVEALAKKNWSVNVKVDSGGGVKTFGDVLTSAMP